METEFDISEKDSAALREAKTALSELVSDRERRRDELMDGALNQEAMRALEELESKIAFAKARVLALRLPGLEARANVYQSLVQITQSDLEQTRIELQKLSSSRV